VSGAEKVIFVCSDGTEDNFVSMEYFPVKGRAAKLVAGWKQFEVDLEAYEPTEALAEAVGKSPDALPALRIEVTGMVTASNLEQFKAHSLAVFSAINTGLQTDQHFADAEKTVKWCGEVEERLEAAKQHALSQTETIDALFRTIDEISEQARRKRLELDKLVKARKVAIRDAPSAKVQPKPIKLEANVTDLHALVKAVYEGRAPISVLTVNWGALDDLVHIQGADFQMDGVTITQVAA
jgi:predicted phage-related endonuclease